MSTVKTRGTAFCNSACFLYALNGFKHVLRNHIGFVVCPSASEFAKAVFSSAGQNKNPFATGVVRQNDLILSHIADNV